ncbi:MAG: hypothetical protein LUB63_03580 [Oscillospiraceae bacterium]|nr:hypothetical protein [Oscillospiraceae bacterium]
MEEFEFNAPLEAGSELEAFLNDNGVSFQRAAGRFRFQFTSQGCRWQTVCDCVGSRVLIYGIHPTPVQQRASALECCSELNRKVVQGGCFLTEDRLVFRTQADLFEPCAARESLNRALEYNAAVMTAFWADLAAGARGSQFSP